MNSNANMLAIKLCQATRTKTPRLIMKVTISVKACTFCGIRSMTALTVICFPSTAAQAMASFSPDVEPDEDWAEEYEDSYDVWKENYDQLEEW